MVVRESALITLQPGPSGYAELLDVLSLYHATVIEEGPDVLVAELTGPEAFVLSCLRAVERFGIVDVARSGAVAIARPAPASRASTPSEVRVP
jgi:acetolactate synthase-1/3 small subunit